jgi:putative membrane protein
MSHKPYARFDGHDLILRDELAIDRTLLANERTLMAYLRSGVALIIAGVSIIHFVSEGWFRFVGVACIPLGVITGAVGVLRYRRMNGAITLVRQQAGKGAKPAAPGQV